MIFAVTVITQFMWAYLIVMITIFLFADSASAASIEPGCMQELANFGLNWATNDAQQTLAEIFHVTHPCG